MKFLRTNIQENKKLVYMKLLLTNIQDNKKLV